MWKQLCVLGFGFGVLMGGQCAAKEALGLQNTITLHKDSLSLSDIFKGLNPDRDAVVSRAPKAGGQFMLSRSWVTKTAQNYGLSWNTGNNFQPITVKRHAFIFSSNNFAIALEEELKNQTHLDHIHLEIRGISKSLIIPSYSQNDLEPELFVESLQIQGGNFKATLSTGAQSIQIRGRYAPLVEVPTLVRSFRKGALITDEDIQWIQVPAFHISSSTILDEANLVGKAPKGRMIKANTPITQGQIVRPILVKQGEIITLNVKSPGLFLSTQGKTLEKGGAGDTIRVTSLDTGRVIYATLSQGGVAEITLASTTTGSAVS